MIESVGILELSVFAVMVLLFAVLTFFVRLPIGISMAVAAVTGGVMGGYLFPLDDFIRHLVEGMFAYLDPILIIATATIFMCAVDRNGTIETLAHWMLRMFQHNRVLLLAMISLIIMLPGMLTGSSTAAVLTTGALMAPVLMYLGIPRTKAGAVIAMSALFGMVAPPVNIPALIIGAGVDLPYIGLDLPLLAFTVPLALLSTWTIALPNCRKIARDEKILDNLPPNHLPECGVLMFLPLVVVLVLILGERLQPSVVNLGLPLIFMIGALLTLFTGRKSNFLHVSRDAMHKAMPILGILMGVGMFIQVMTLTGARGEVVIQTLQLPRGWLGLYPVIGTAMPLFGAVSSYGAASVLGAPFLLALPTGSEVIVMNAAMLSMIVALGDLMPPTALAGIFAAQVVGEPKYSRVLRWCIVPGIVTAVVSLLAIQYSAWLAPILVHF